MVLNLPMTVTCDKFVLPKELVNMTDYAIQQAADLIHKASYVMVLTGAGVSTPSGIPDFRSPSSGIWNKLDPMVVASIWGYHEHPDVFYRWFMPLARQIRQARPNPAHFALAELEQVARLNLLATQNIDSLHQTAGSRHVVELHGHLRSASCLACAEQAALDDIWPLAERGEAPRCPACGGLMKPDVILFGEPLPYDALRASQEGALFCDVLISIGTSLEVEPAADLPHLARRSGSRVIIINRQPTIADKIADLVIHDDAAKALPALVQALRH
jgi:NAD-dependent deacetylase